MELVTINKQHFVSPGFQKKIVTKRYFKKVIKREIAVFEDGRGRGPNLESVNNFLLTIKPSRVSIPKGRCKLSDAMLPCISIFEILFSKNYAL